MAAVVCWYLGEPWVLDLLPDSSEGVIVTDVLLYAVMHGGIVEGGIGVLRDSSVNANGATRGAAGGKAGGEVVVVEGGEAEAGLAGGDCCSSASCRPSGRYRKGEEVAYDGIERGIGGLVLKVATWGLADIAEVDHNRPDSLGDLTTMSEDVTEVFSN